MVSREINVIQIDLPNGITVSLEHKYIWAMSGVLGADSQHCFNTIDKMDSKIGFETSLVVGEAIRGRCASFMIPTATVSEIFGGQTNSSILVL